MSSHVHTLVQAHLTEPVVRPLLHFVQNPSRGCRYLPNAVGCVQSGTRCIESVGGRPVINAAWVPKRRVSEAS